MSLSDAGDNFENEGLCQPGNENTGRWTSDEHRLFLKGLELHGKGWKQIATLIQTRTVVQIRTHAQKYFQKLTKAQASGTSHLDPATLMSTMDAGKPRPATVARNLRSSTIASSAADTEERLRSLRKRRNRGRHPRNNVDESDDGDTSCDDIDSKSSSNLVYCRRRSCSSSSRTSRSSERSHDGDGASSDEEAEEDLDEEGRGETPGVRQQADHIAVHGDGSGGGSLGLVEAGPQGDEEPAKSTINVDAKTSDGGGNNILSPSYHTVSSASSSSGKAAGTATTAADAAGGGWTKRRASKKIGRSSPSKASKASAIGAAAREGGAADARALAWEAAAAKAAAAAAGAPGTVSAAVAAVSGTKRNRSESMGSVSGRSAPSHDLSISGSMKDLKRAGGSQGTRISPTSVSDINFMSFPVPQSEYSDVAMHHLPQQLAPSWCTKPQDNWAAMAGFDMGVDPDDAGPFRWFIDERSLSAPGAFFQPPVENWSGSDTTDASTAAGVSSGGEGLDSDYRTVVPVVPSTTSTSNMVDASPGGNDGLEVSTNSYPAKRRSFEPPVTVDSERLRYSADAASASDSAIAIEVNKHVEADTDGLDITSGLWLDHPQEASSLMCGLGLNAPSAAGPGASLSLPSLDEDEVLGFLACEENRVAGNMGM